MTDLEQRLRAALHRQSEHVRTSRRLQERIDARLRTSGAFRTRMVAVSVVAATVTVGVVAWVVAGTRVVREDVAGPAPTPTSAFEPDAAHADEAFRCIVRARHDRDLEAGRTCMTTRYRDSITDPVEFIGPSSPSVERATIIGSTRTGDRIEYSTLVYWGSSAGLEYSTDDSITVVHEGGAWRVDSWLHGGELPIGETVSVTMRFLAAGDTPKCAGDRPTPDSFVSVERVVPRPSGPSSRFAEDLALSVARELVTGPWPHEPLDKTPAFPPGVRVSAVTRTSDGLRIRVMDPWRQAGQPVEECDMQLEALTQTLHSVPELRDLRIALERVGPPEA